MIGQVPDGSVVDGGSAGSFGPGAGGPVSFVPPPGPGGTTKLERRNQSLGALPPRPPRNKSYVKAPPRASPVSVKAPEIVVPPLIAFTTRIPLAVVSAPGPVVLWISRPVEPLAVPPLIISRSDGEPSPPR
jgi:hypothetical protein